MMSIVKDDAAFDFMKYRKIAALASVVTIVVGCALFAVRFDSMFGVDFREGTNVTLAINASEVVDIGSVRSKLTEGGFAEAIVQEVADEKNQFVVRTAQIETGARLAIGSADAGAEATAPTEAMTIAQRMQDALKGLADDPNAAVDTAVPLLSEQSVGPAVGEQLRRDAFLAVAYSLACILLYVAFRFEFWYAVGAIVATIHDVVITVALFAIVGREISMNVVAAVLTIVGYSLNDTIVVYDRIREDRQLYRGKGFGLLDIMNRAINQTLSRTILTGGTTLIVVVVLLFLGGTVINDFAFALFWGIIVGTYSSVFVASPFVYYAQTWWTARRQRRLDERAEARKRGKKKPATAQ